MLLDLGVIPEIDNLDVLDELILEELEEEYSDNEELDYNKVLQFLIDGPELIIRIILYITRKFKEVFPKVVGKRRLHLYKFDTILTQL